MCLPSLLFSSSICLELFLQQLSTIFVEQKNRSKSLVAHVLNLKPQPLTFEIAHDCTNRVARRKSQGFAAGLDKATTFGTMTNRNFCENFFRWILNDLLKQKRNKTYLKQVSKMQNKMVQFNAIFMTVYDSFFSSV